jgi:hypothetical protein
VILAQFDTVLVSSGSNGMPIMFTIMSIYLMGVAEQCAQHVAKVWVIFQILAKVASELFTQPHPPTHLAYIEWFFPFPSEPNHYHLMY